MEQDDAWEEWKNSYIESPKEWKPKHWKALREWRDQHLSLFSSVISNDSSRGKADLVDADSIKARALAHWWLIGRPL